MGKHSRKSNPSQVVMAGAAVSCVVCTLTGVVLATNQSSDAAPSTVVAAEAIPSIEPTSTLALPTSTEADEPARPIYAPLPGEKDAPTASQGDTGSSLQTSTTLPSPSPSPTSESAATATTEAPIPSEQEPEPNIQPAFQDLDCDDFSSQEEAQAKLEENSADPHGLDADDNGEACQAYKYSDFSAQVEQAAPEMVLEAPAADQCNPQGGLDLQSHAALATADIVDRFGFRGSLIGRAPRGNSTSDHPSGLATDFMTSNRELGDSIVNYALENHVRLAVKYVIWQQTYFTPRDRDGKMMADRGGATANHYDHVHISFVGSPGSEFQPQC